MSEKRQTKIVKPKLQQTLQTKQLPKLQQVQQLPKLQQNEKTLENELESLKLEIEEKFGKQVEEKIEKKIEDAINKFNGQSSIVTKENFLFYEKSQWPLQMLIEIKDENLEKFLKDKIEEKLKKLKYESMKLEFYKKIKLKQNGTIPKNELETLESEIKKEVENIMNIFYDKNGKISQENFFLFQTLKPEISKESEKSFKKMMKEKLEKLKSDLIEPNFTENLTQKINEINNNIIRIRRITKTTAQCASENLPKLKNAFYDVQTANSNFDISTEYTRSIQ